HGEGPLPTFCPALTARLPDPGNPRNRWQGGLRSGWLDLPLLRYAAAATGPLDGLVVNHLDQAGEGEWLGCDRYRGPAPAPPVAPNLAWQRRLTRLLSKAEPVLSAATPDGIVARLGEVAPVVLAGFGPTYEGRRLLGELPFRRGR